MISYRSIPRIARAVREASPIVHCITNHVTSGFVANALLAVGASPAMVEAEEEVEQFLSAHPDNSALLINLGTVTSAQLVSMLRAAETARRWQIPWVLDPVAAGQLEFRTQLAWNLIHEHRPTVIRANASEIAGLVGGSGSGSGSNEGELGRGADSSIRGEAVLARAQELARRTESIVVISGPEDYITDGQSTTLRLSNGSPLMRQVTGTGCVLSAVVAAFLATSGGANRNDRMDQLHAVMAAVTHCSLAGELTAEDALVKGPGSFGVVYLDHLANLATTEGDCYKRAKIERL